MPINIRKAAKNDAGGVVRLGIRAYAEAHSDSNYGDWIFLKTPSKSNMLKWFTNLLSDAKYGNAVYLIAEVDGDVAGHCFVRREMPGSELSHVGVLSLLVDKKYRRMGIGSRLLDSTIKASKGKFETIYSTFFASNDVSKRLCRSRGYKTFGVAPGFVKRAGDT